MNLDVKVVQAVGNRPPQNELVPAVRRSRRSCSMGASSFLVLVVLVPKKFLAVLVLSRSRSVRIGSFAVRVVRRS